MTRRWQRLCAMLALVPSQRQAYAMDYLEHHGQEFCVHFGLGNAEEKAIAIYMAELEQEARHGSRHRQVP